jgi:hypothetical protein
MAPIIKLSFFLVVLAIIVINSKAASLGNNVDDSSEDTELDNNLRELDTMSDEIDKRARGGRGRPKSGGKSFYEKHLYAFATTDVGAGEHCGGPSSCGRGLRCVGCCGSVKNGCCNRAKGFLNSLMAGCDNVCVRNNC